MPSEPTQDIAWDDISPLPKPLKTPNSSSPRVLVIGGGVTGLITSWVLLDRGYHVTIVSKEWPSWTNGQRLTSQIAGALWEYPPASCGMHTDVISLEKSKEWSMVSYRIFSAIAEDEALAAKVGVRMRLSNFFFPYRIEDDEDQHKKMLEIQQSDIRGFKRIPSFIKEHGINPTFGAVDGYQHLAPVIDTDQAMGWLMEIVRAKGAKLVTETIHGSLLNIEDEVRARFQADVIVNATGLAGIELADDKTCYPLRGGVIRVINDGSDFPQIKAALIMSADALHNLNETVFIVPRNDKILLLGSIAEPYEWHVGGLQLDTPIIERMRKRCEDFLPVLKKARLDPDYPLAQGLRPFRGTNVRVERELRLKPGIWGARTRPSRIIHSYGHGGAGWSLSFGCAGDIAALVTDALNDITPTPMTLTDGVIPEVQKVVRTWEPISSKL